MSQPARGIEPPVELTSTRTGKRFSPCPLPHLIRAQHYSARIGFTFGWPPTIRDVEPFSTVRTTNQHCAAPPATSARNAAPFATKPKSRATPAPQWRIRCVAPPLTSRPAKSVCPAPRSRFRPRLMATTSAWRPPANPRTTRSTTSSVPVITRAATFLVGGAARFSAVRAGRALSPLQIAVFQVGSARSAAALSAHAAPAIRHRSALDHGHSRRSNDDVLLAVARITSAAAQICSASTTVAISR